MSTPILKQVAPLTENQIAQFKREGSLVLPEALDPVLCRQVRNKMWKSIQTYLPRIKRENPSTWTSITEEESAKLKAQRPLDGGDPYFGGSGHRFTVRNGAEELMLTLGPEHCGQLPSNFLGEEHGFDSQGLTS